MGAYDQTERVTSPGAVPSTSAVAPTTEQHQQIGCYRLIEEIGEGGMGVVHLALDPRGKAVAIKVLRTHVAHDDDARARLGREVETLSRIRDDRVASVIDADIMGPRPYIVTRYVPGTALDDLVAEEGPLAPDELLRLARGMAEAIRAIHSCGVVHRDIKPGNVLIEEGEPVLIDFGIAHLQDDVRHTVGGLVMGTPGYLSPELVEGAAITDATDWWGWAATITFAASGRPPFGRGRMDAVLSRVRSGEVDLEGVDPRLVPLLRASLSPRPEERPQADDVIDALERFARGHSATVPSPSGQVWDDPHRQVDPGSTQTIEGRGTAVMPGVLPGQPTPLRTPEPPSSRWEPPTRETLHREAGSAAYGMDVPGEGWGERDGGDDDGWDPGPAGGDDDAYTVGRQGDPRIMLPLRKGALLGVAVGWLGLAAAFPGVAVVALVVWCVVARTIDRSITGLVLRRYSHGWRRSDVPLSVLLAPWHLLVGLVGAAATLIIPGLVGLAGIFSSALLVAGLTSSEIAPGSPVTLLCGGLLGLGTLWWGLGGVSLRRGSRSIVRALAPAGLPSQLVTGVLVAVGLLLVLLALNGGAALGWTPWSGSPFAG